MQNTPSSYGTALKHWPSPQLGQSSPTMPRSRTKQASLSLSSSKHFRRLQSVKIFFPSKVSRNHKYFLRRIRRGHKDKLSRILGSSYGMMCPFRKDTFPPLCLTLSISSTNTPTLKSFPKVLKIYRQKVPYKKLYLHFNREQQQPKKRLILSYGWGQSSPT